MLWPACCQVDSAGLLRAEKARAQALAREANSQDVDEQHSQGRTEDVAGAREASGQDGLQIALGEGRQQDGGGSEELDGQEGRVQGEAASDSSGKKIEMLPMGGVGHLGRADRLGIIRKTVPKERRMAVLQRLFQLAQGESQLSRFLVRAPRAELSCAELSSWRQDETVAVRATGRTCGTLLSGVFVTVQAWRE